MFLYIHTVNYDTPAQKPFVAIKQVEVMDKGVAYAAKAAVFPYRKSTWKKSDLDVLMEWSANPPLLEYFMVSTEMKQVLYAQMVAKRYADNLIALQADYELKLTQATNYCVLTENLLKSGVPGMITQVCKL